MPIFEYHCKRCGKDAEILQRSGSDRESPPCTSCGHPEMERKFSCFSSTSGGAAKASGISGSGGCRPSSGFR